MRRFRLVSSSTDPTSVVEGQSGDLLFVAGDADETAIQAGAIAAQQGLRRGEPESGTGVGIISGALRIQRRPAVAEVQADLRAGGEALLDAGVVIRSAGDQRAGSVVGDAGLRRGLMGPIQLSGRSEEHTSELQSLRHLVCRLL